MSIKTKNDVNSSNYTSSQLFTHAEHYNAGEDADTFQLSDADRSSYEKVFSSILVPYTALTIGEEIGQGACEGACV